MDDGTRLAYCDPRRFGRIKLRGAEPEELAALAPDALTLRPSQTSANPRKVGSDPSCCSTRLPRLWHSNWPPTGCLCVWDSPATAASALSSDCKALRGHRHRVQDGLRRERRLGEIPGDVALPPPLGQADDRLDRVADRAHPLRHDRRSDDRVPARRPDEDREACGEAKCQARFKGEEAPGRDAVDDAREETLGREEASDLSPEPV